MIISTIIMILLIGFLIFVHELGHFLAAKIIGAKVDKFALGFPIGPTLYSKKIGDVEFIIHAFLFGGYVAFPDDEKNDLPKDSPLLFANKSVGQRAFVISAGVIMNVVVAYVLIFLVGAFWHQLPSQSYTTSFSKFADTVIESNKNTGIKENDIIHTVNGVEAIYHIILGTFGALSKEFDGKIDEKIAENKLVELKKLNPSYAKTETIPAGKIIKLPNFTDEKPVNITMDNILGLEKYKSTEIKLTNEQKDLRDKINYQKTYKTETETTLNDIAYAISDTKKPITITVLRDGEEIHLKTFYADKTGMLGMHLAIEENFKEIKNVKELFKQTIDYAYQTEKMMVYSLTKLFTGKAEVSQLSGIIAVTKIGAKIIENKGLAQGILLAAMISLNLAILNILPIPALDGGHLLFLIIEKITGKKPNEKFVEGLSMFFFYILLTLIILLIFKDIHSLIIGKI